MLSFWCLIKWHGKFAGYFVIYIEVNKNKSDNLRQNYKKFKSASDFSVFFADLYTFNYISSITNNWVAHCCFIIKDIFTCKLKLSFQAAMKWYFSIYNFCSNVKCFGGLSTEHQLLSDDKPLFSKKGKNFLCNIFRQDHFAKSQHRALLSWRERKREREILCNLILQDRTNLLL